MFGTIDRALRRLYTVCGYISGLLLIGLTGTVILSIVSRLISVYVPGLTAIAGYTMAASAFFGMAYTFTTGGHIRVTLVTGRFAGRAKHGTELWCLGAAAVVMGYVAFYLCRMVYFSYQFGERSQTADNLPLWAVQSPMAVGAVVFAICTAHIFVAALIDPQTMDRMESRQGSDL